MNGSEKWGGGWTTRTHFTLGTFHCNESNRIMNLFSSIFESADGINWKLYIIIILATLRYGFHFSMIPECRIRSQSSSLELAKSENGVKEWQGIGVHETCQLFLSCLDAMIGALLVWFCNVYSCSTICLEGQRGL